MRDVGRQVFGRAAYLGAVGLVAIGASGVVAAVGGRLLGRSWVAGDPPSVHYSATRCADFYEYAPHAHSCEQAATWHHFGEVVDYRIAAGIAGIAILLACWAGARRGWRIFRTDRLPVAFGSTVAFSAFALAGAGLVSYGVDQQALGYQGAGFYLSAGIVAVIAAALSAWQFRRRTTAAAT